MSLYIAKTFSCMTKCTSYDYTKPSNCKFTYSRPGLLALKSRTIFYVRYISQGTWVLREFGMHAQISLVFFIYKYLMQ